jgi:hypothetical protein
MFYIKSLHVVGSGNVAYSISSYIPVLLIHLDFESAIYRANGHNVETFQHQFMAVTENITAVFKISTTLQAAHT